MIYPRATSDVSWLLGLGFGGLDRFLLLLRYAPTPCALVLHLVSYDFGDLSNPSVVPLKPNFLANSLLTCHQYPFGGSRSPYGFLSPISSVCPAGVLPLDDVVVDSDYFREVFSKLSLVSGLAFSKSADLLYPQFSGTFTYWTLILKCPPTSTLITGVSSLIPLKQQKDSTILGYTLMLSLSDSTFSGGGDDEGSAAANSVMHALVDDDRGVWY
ncbi:hypothetical protein Tco_1448811 [Tanacetum coccineum]